MPQNTISKISRFLAKPSLSMYMNSTQFKKKFSFTRVSMKTQFAGGSQPAAPTMRELAMVLFRQRRVFVWAFALAFAASALYALAGTKYQANMNILVRRGRADAPLSAGENAPLDLTRIAITEEELNSEVELLRDDEVLRKVAEETGGGGRDWLHFLRMTQEGRAERVEREARRLGETIAIEPVKKTNLISIGYASADPQTAERVLLSLAKVYLEKHVSVHRPDGELHFFEQQAAEARRQLEGSQQRLLQFTASHKVIAACQERDLALQKLSDLDISARQTRIEVAETKQRVAELEKQVSTLPERTTTQVRTADNPELLRKLVPNLLDSQ